MRTSDSKHLRNKTKIFAWAQLENLFNTQTWFLYAIRFIYKREGGDYNEAKWALLLHERTKMPIPFIIYWKSILFCVYIICRALLLLKLCRSIECSHHRRLADILKNINTTIDKMILSRLLFSFLFFFFLFVIWNQFHSSYHYQRYCLSLNV